jgi:hypothetical protein
VVALLSVVPDRYQAAVHLGAGEGMRLGEVLGFEATIRCFNPDHGEVHVVQQLRFHKAEYGGFYLAPPKAGSIGDVDLDDEVGAVLAQHIENYPPVLVELPDITAGTPDPGKQPRRRHVALLFTDDQSRPIQDLPSGWSPQGTRSIYRTERDA